MEKTNRNVKEREKRDGTLTFEREAWCPVEQNKMENMMRTIKKSWTWEQECIRWRGGQIQFAILDSSYKAVRKAACWLTFRQAKLCGLCLLSPKMAKLGDPISCCEMIAGIRVNVGTVKTGVEEKMKYDKKNKNSCQPVSDLQWSNSLLPWAIVLTIEE